MKKYKSIAISLLTIALLFFIVGVVMQLMYKTANSKKSKSKEDGITVSEDLVIAMCVDETNCDYSPEVKYPLIKINYANDELQKALKTINDITKENYEKSLSSTLIDTSCQEVKDKYQHSLAHRLNYNLYEDKEIISIALERSEQNLCTKEYKTNPPEVMIFSKKDNKFITQQELKKLKEIEDIDIQTAIKRNIETQNSVTNTAYSYENIKQDETSTSLYYMNDGSLHIYYFQPEDSQYHTAKIR